MKFWKRWTEKEGSLIILPDGSVDIVCQSRKNDVRAADVLANHPGYRLGCLSSSGSQSIVSVSHPILPGCTYFLVPIPSARKQELSVNALLRATGSEATAAARHVTHRRSSMHAPRPGSSHSLARDWEIESLKVEASCSSSHDAAREWCDYSKGKGRTLTWDWSADNPPAARLARRSLSFNREAHVSRQQKAAVEREEAAQQLRTASNRFSCGYVQPDSAGSVAVEGVKSQYVPTRSNRQRAVSFPSGGNLPLSRFADFSSHDNDDHGDGGDSSSAAIVCGPTSGRMTVIAVNSSANRVFLPLTTLTSSLLHGGGSSLNRRSSISVSGASSPVSSESSLSSSHSLSSLPSLPHGSRRQSVYVNACYRRSSPQCRVSHAQQQQHHLHYQQHYQQQQHCPIVSAGSEALSSVAEGGTCC